MRISIFPRLRRRRLTLVIAASVLVLVATGVARTGRASTNAQEAAQSTVEVEVRGCAPNTPADEIPEEAALYVTLETECSEPMPPVGFTLRAGEQIEEATTDDAGRAAWSVAAGELVLREDIPPGYGSVVVFCRSKLSDGSERGLHRQPAGSDASIAYAIEEGETLACTWYNLAGVPEGPSSAYCAAYLAALQSGSDERPGEVTGADADLATQRCLVGHDGYLQPSEGQTVVVVDKVSNVVCVKTVDAGTAGGACTAADATEPMVLMSYGGPSDPARVVVVDPQQRLGTLEVVVGGQALAPIDDAKDQGLWIDATFSALPDTLTIFDTNHNQLAVHELAKDEREADAADEQAGDDEPQQ